jgi:hypothetical protein
MSDEQSAVDHTTISSTGYNFSGDATYEFAFGAVSLLPEIGFLASEIDSGAGDFADVGRVDIDNGATIDAYAGGTLRGRWVMADGATTFTPYLSLLIHGEPAASATARFTDFAGGSAQLPLDHLGTYDELGLGADLLRAPKSSAQALSAGFKADFKFGSNVHESSYGGYAEVEF